VEKTKERKKKKKKNKKKKGRRKGKRNSPQNLISYTDTVEKKISTGFQRVI